MTDIIEPPVTAPIQPVMPAPVLNPTAAMAPAPAYAAAGQPAQPYAQQYAGPIGKVRSTGSCVLLTIVTLGVYTWFWYSHTAGEMKRHTGDGIGGGVALLLAIFVSIAMPFVIAGEVGDLYGRRGQDKPVSGTTGFWAFLPLVGLIVWFVKTNGALNDYWRSLGAQG